MTSTLTSTRSSATTSPSGAARAFPMLIGLTSLGILAQSLMAGVFLQDDGNRDAYATWITAHGVGADVTTVLSLLATIAAFVGFRQRKALGIVSLALLVLLLVESLLGHLINGSIGGSDHNGLTVIHIPLGMLLLALATWLSVQSALLRRTSGSSAAVTRSA